jgi:hypothetical protein
MNWKGCGRKQLWPYLKLHAGICLEQLTEMNFNRTCSKICMAVHNCDSLNYLNVLMLLENHEFPQY